MRIDDKLQISSATCSLFKNQRVRHSGNHHKFGRWSKHQQMSEPDPNGPTAHVTGCILSDQYFFGGPLELGAWRSQLCLVSILNLSMLYPLSSRVNICCPLVQRYSVRFCPTQLISCYIYVYIISNTNLGASCDSSDWKFSSQPLSPCLLVSLSRCYSAWPQSCCLPEKWAVSSWRW